MPWSPTFAVILMIAILVYAILSIYMKRAIGLFMAALMHVILGLLSLPSIGIYVLIIAGVELIAGIIFTLQLRRQ